MSIDYLGGFHYQGTALKFFPTAEGYVQATALKVGFAYSYVYNYTDHLGNIRLSYAQDPENPNVLKIIEESHYYPFGLKHTNYNSDQLAFKEKDPGPGLMLMAAAAAVDPVPQFVYNYKYNGKEFQDELGLDWYDYGARNYDPAIGRWMNIDPLAEKGRRWSPYTYVMDNPVFFIDPDGMEAITPTELFNTNGKKIGEDANGNDGNVSIIKDEEKAKKIENSYKKGGIASEADVASGVQTTKTVLSEALDTLQRTIDNGGKKEETSVVEPNGNITRGTAETVKTDNISRTSMPIVDGNDNTGIHSHVPLSPIKENGNIVYSSALRPGPDDPAAFKKYSSNIIVGRLGDQTARIENGKIFFDTKPATGAAIYNRDGTFLLSLTKNVIEKIIK